MLGGDAVAEGVREDLRNIEAEGVALGFSAEVGVDDIVLFLGRAEAEHVVVAGRAEVAFVELLAVGAGVAAGINGDLARGEPLVAPPIVAGVFEATGLHFMPEPVFVKRTAELIDDLLLQALEEILSDLEDGALLCSCQSDIDHHGLGREADGERDIGAEGAHDGFVGLAGNVVLEGFELFAWLEAREEDAVRKVGGGEVADFVAGGFHSSAEADLGDFGGGDHVADLRAGLIRALNESVNFADVAEVGGGRVKPRDATRLALAADVSEMEDVFGGNAEAVFAVERVGYGRAVAIKNDAVVRIASEGSGPADGLAAEESDASRAFFGLQKLREEIAVDGDLAEDETLRGVEIDLAGRVEGPCLGAVSIFEILIDLFVPLGVAGLWLNDDAGADGALGEVLDEVGGLRGVVVKPAGETEDFKACVRGEFSLRIGGRNPDEATIQRGLGGFEGGGFGVELAGAACSGAGSSPRGT